MDKETRAQKQKALIDDLFAIFHNGKYIPAEKIKWKCLRCKEIVDMDKFRCGCETSPSPWEPFFE